MTTKEIKSLLPIWPVLFMLSAALGASVLAQPRQLKTLQEHPTAKAMPPVLPKAAQPVGSCVLDDGTEVNVYLEPK